LKLSKKRQSKKELRAYLIKEIQDSSTTSTMVSYEELDKKSIGELELILSRMESKNSEE
jgi:hypothetical protein